ncbi:hypothetical protein Tco_0611679 [Tanacetum coccineum]
MEIRTQQPEEPENTLEYEFKDLHLSLPVLEVLAHASMYNAILDKYVESLELCKNGSAFIQGKMPKKIEDPRLFTLPCRLGNSKPFDTLADLRAYVNIITLYLFKKLNIGLLEETNHKDPETPLLVGRGFLATANAVIDCRKAKIAVGEGITRTPTNWDKPPKNGDGAWHAKIRLIDPDGEEFTKTLQSVPTSRKLSEKEDPREIIDLDHFYDT